MKLIRSILLSFLLSTLAHAQYVTLAQPKMQFFDNNGNPLNGGKLFAYAAGTSTPHNTFSTSSGTANANPVILDSAGRATIFLDSVAYKFVLEDSGNNIIWTVDNYTPWNLLPTVSSLSLATLTVTGTLTLPDGITANASGFSGFIAQNAATFNGGIVTLAGTNSTISIGTGGNFYTRSYSGFTNCAGTADGWLAVTTDTNLLTYCTNNTLTKLPTLAANQTWTGNETYSGTATFNSTSSFASAAAFNGGILGCTNGAGSAPLGGCNNAISIGAGGHLWINLLSGVDLTCGAGTGNDGLIVLRTDTQQLQYCQNGTTYKVAHI